MIVAEPHGVNDMAVSIVDAGQLALEPRCFSLVGEEHGRAQTPVLVGSDSVNVGRT